VRGLYRKALTFHELSLERDRASSEASNGHGDGISDEERAQIQGKIDGILSENRIQVSPQMLSYTPRRHGALLPVITNVAVFAAFALAGIVIFRLLNHQEQYIATGQANVQGAENKLIAAMRQQAEEQLRERDRAILDAQQKLQALPQEEQRLREQSETALKAREQELAAQFDQRLAQEKDRLAKLGLSPSARAERLRVFEAARRREADRQVAAARQQAETDLAARQKSMAVLASQLQDELTGAQQGRAQAQKDLTEKEASLRGQYAASLQAAQTENAAAVEELARLRAQREKEQLVQDQILAGYSRVSDAFQKQDYIEAQKGLDSLRAYLTDPSMAALPTIQKRSPVEVFLVDSLSDLIRARRYAASADAASLAEAGAQARSVSELVARGDELSKAGNLAAARDAYLQAMRVIPAVNKGYLKLDDMRTGGDQEAVRSALDGIQQGNLFYQAGNFQGSIERYRSAVSLLLKDESIARQLTTNMMNAGYRVLASDDLAALARLRSDAAKRHAILKRLMDLRSQYAAYAALAPQGSNQSESQSLASLLQAKVVLLQILDSDPVRSQHPELGVDIERYFVALEQQGKGEGRRAAIDELSSMLGVKSSPAGSAVDPLAALLDRLQQILSAP
jgi:hypothetical protein